MADNTTLNTGAGGDVISTDDISGVKTQRVKVQYGADGSASDVHPYLGLPVIPAQQACDAFGRLRVASPHTLFDSKLIGLDDAPLFWDEQIETGSGITASTPTANVPYIDFTSTLATACKFTRQTRRRFVYQPGKSQLVLLTGVLDLSGGSTGVQRRIGLFDDDNGIFFENDTDVIGVTVRSKVSGSVVDTTATQANWNIDVMDGTGQSGVTAAWTAAQIFVIDFQWLAIGRIRFGLEIDGALHWVHQTSASNTSSVPYMSTPNLPIRYQMITTGNSLVSSMRCICSAVMSEGGADPVGASHAHATTDHINANAADVIYAVLGVRLKSTHLGCDITPESISMLAETADDFEWILYINPDVAGTFTYSNLTNSCCQIATGVAANPSTNVVTNGTIIARGFGAASSNVGTPLRTSVKLGALIDGTQDTLVLAARPLATNCDIQGALTWSERS